MTSLDLHSQLANAIGTMDDAVDGRSLSLMSCTDTGSVNLVIVVPSVPIRELHDGLVVVVDVLFANTLAACYLKISGFAAMPMVWPDGSPVVAGDVQGATLFRVGSVGKPGGPVAKLVGLGPKSMYSRSSALSPPAPVITGITSVAHDSTLFGDGTTLNPLGVVPSTATQWPIGSYVVASGLAANMSVGTVVAGSAISPIIYGGGMVATLYTSPVPGSWDFRGMLLSPFGGSYAGLYRRVS